VATVTLCRPSARTRESHRPVRSVLADTPDWDVLGALARLGRDLSGAVRVVVLRCTGASVVRAGQLAAVQDAVSWLRRADLISVAVVPGPISGVSLTVALSCDLRVAADDARFAITEVSDGLIGPLGATHHLVRLVGYPRALEWCLTGRSIRSDEALQSGLVNRVVSPEELDAAVTALVTTIVAAGRDAVIETKALLAGASDRTLNGQDEAERAAVARLSGITE
jgi:enoyl-CoA hydratase/carnithine racemase